MCGARLWGLGLTDLPTREHEEGLAGRLVGGTAGIGHAVYGVGHEVWLVT